MASPVATYLGYVAVATLVWVVADWIICLAASQCSRTFVKRASRTIRERGRWRSRLVSTAHAIYGSCAAAYVILFRPWTPDESLFSTEPLKMMLLAGSVGYFVFDTYVMLVYQEKEVAYYLHHAVVGGGMLIAMLSEFCAFAFVAMTINEFTTPMLNMAWIMNRMRLNHSTLFKVNGVVIAVGFFCARICFNLFIAYHYLSPDTLAHFPAPIGNTPTTLGVSAIAIFFFPLYFLYLGTNFFWFAKLVKEVRSFVRGEASAALDDESDGELHLMGGDTDVEEEEEEADDIVKPRRSARLRRSTAEAR
uniref:TLC domain-containing protein n=1 Tax=Bicosoecida sp. CB-2014 TaxID=1486930 RepID=A0A7S1CEW3_9STRA|mmetsp:Transcript_22770/g.79561  ORF Transcript_22770/g.79561 Transcript_22770/m.79561 type:complete len:306 (+) Transcript_22770:174-1091(+)